MVGGARGAPGSRKDFSRAIPRGIDWEKEKKEPGLKRITAGAALMGAVWQMQQWWAGLSEWLDSSCSTWTAKERTADNASRKPKCLNLTLMVLCHDASHAAHW